MKGAEEYRQYLLRLAREQTADRLAGKVDLSGVVQQTLFEAHQHNGALETWDDHHRVAWLRQALANNLRDEVRRFTASARDIDREERPADVTADQTTPSAAADRGEKLSRLAAALALLPPHQRRVIELHHLGGLPLVETAAEMGKTVQSVVGLLFRGMRRLRELMPQE